MGYKYYDTPDGQDCGKKLAYLVKRAGVIGIYLSSSYVLAIETPPTYPLIFARFVRITTPCIAVAAAGAISVCMLVDIRKKDDQYNHLYGGIVGGIAGGLAKGHFGQGLGVGIILGLVAATYKNMKIANVNFVTPPFKSDIGITRNVDLSLYNKRPVEWVAK